MTKSLWRKVSTGRLESNINIICLSGESRESWGIYLPSVDQCVITRIEGRHLEINAAVDRQVRVSLFSNSFLLSGDIETYQMVGLNYACIFKKLWSNVCLNTRCCFTVPDGCSLTGRGDWGIIHGPLFKFSFSSIHETKFKVVINFQIFF